MTSNTNAMSVNLKKFDVKSLYFRPDEPQNVSKAPVIVLIGSRGTGKSTLIEDILYNFQDIPVGTAISGTEIGNHFYEKHIPKMLIHHEYTSGVIQNVLLRQRQIMNLRTTQMNQHGGRTNIDARTFVIMDDCLYDDKWTRDKLMRLIFLNGRHWKVLLIITSQYVMGIPPILRSNIDYTFILRETSRSNREKIWKHYASVFQTFESFCEVLDQTTADYECMVINNVVKSNKLEDMVFWYKAVVHPAYKLCSKEYWNLSKDLPETDEDGYNPANNKKGPQMLVKKQN